MCSPSPSLSLPLSLCVCVRVCVCVCVCVCAGSSLELVSAVSLAIALPLLRPLRWQSLLLPILPHKLLSFLDAPVPFVVGLPRPAAGCVPRLHHNACLLRARVY